MVEQAYYFNPWDPEFRANPYPHYPALLAGPPRVTILPGAPFALVARYRDAITVLRDHANFSSVGPPPPPDQYQGPFAGSKNVLNSDPPDHTRLRRLVSRDFTPRRIRELEPRIREIARTLVDKAAMRGEFDVMADLANILPVMVIAEMLGVPADKSAMFKDWSDRIIAAGNTIPGAPPPAEAVQALEALAEYFGGEIERRRRHPGADLVSALVAAHDDSDALSAGELLSFVSLLLIAGNETTTNLIGNGALALMHNPAQLEMLRREPAMLPRAIEEMLRYDGPVQSTARFPKSAVKLVDAEIPAGSIVVVVIAAANRDPAQFPDPERFDITRDPNDHLAFGEGIHFCIGAPLARMEANIAFSAMFERFARLRLRDPDAKLNYKGSYFLRGLDSLKAALD
ncbi:MAG TPA: cytochrome P450 [Candidatus Binataceae bacterium]|nr:cytochrome P450 [Candidatus Binataceae bacterium]